ncbi:hypothetical protein GMRT_10233 [Giardia muris]|uniref:Uncharacterized protein n=1 Tax=Giardia muris TaxID=5742 RepID=A0A4Z1SUF6_GIAMU|nr:hypothetical protein GMRT_10233 [Giardia muris]|eukprot:TNJ29474.1 hypothetical protein GMRT_10233 [Giardia muris]
MLNTAKLKEITGQADLAEVTDLVLDLEDAPDSIDAIGRFLPNLRRLVLQSADVTILDLAQAFPRLQELGVNGSELTDLTGLGMFEDLVTVSFRGNRLSDLDCFLDCFKLEQIDLRDNRITDIKALYCVMHLPLKQILLSGNPVFEEQKAEIIKLFPSITDFSVPQGTLSSTQRSRSVRVGVAAPVLLKHSAYGYGTGVLVNSPISLLRRKRESHGA